MVAATSDGPELIVQRHWHKPKSN